MKSKLLSGMMLFMVSTGAFAQHYFSTPEQATDALAKAINEQNDNALSNLLGEDWRTFLPTDGIDPEAVDRFKRDWQVNHHTVIDGDMAWLTVGEYHWQLPVPAVKRAGGWQFDMQAAKEEILPAKWAVTSWPPSKPCTPTWMRRTAITPSPRSMPRKLSAVRAKKMGFTGR